MAQPTAVILVVGLTPSLIGEDAPNLRAFAKRGRLRTLRPTLPAVTCSVQSSMLTGMTPDDHGIVGNGWYDRDLCEVQFWKQSNRLVHGEKVWDVARRRDASVTCANLFWWYNMYSSVDFSITPRPIYKADGRKLPDVYTYPSGLRHAVQRKLGTFPLFHFWGPASSIRSSEWIADAAIAVHRKYKPTLNLVYLPHLDYGLQKLGPTDPAIAEHVAEIDAVVGKLIGYYDERGVRVIVVSEYGIEEVDDSIHINRALRAAGHLVVRVEDRLEQLDPGASAAFAVADHQVAHVYVADESRLAEVRNLCEGLDGVERVLGSEEQAAEGLAHERAGELVLVAGPRRWFSYEFWLDEDRAPDFARTVDIHRKPGYDPLELFLDPKLRFPGAKIAGRLIRKKLGFRTLMDVIPLDTRLVRGSHGRTDLPRESHPVLITEHEGAVRPDEVPCTAVRDVILEHLFD